MLSIEDDVTRRFSDGIHRRDLLKIGALGLGFGGLTLADMLRLQAQTGVPSGCKAVISIHLEGGPPQMDTFDMKPDAPLELRGEFRPIRTSVPGTYVCELLPRLARLADRYTILRSVVGNVDAHNFDTTQLGYPGLRMPKPAMRSIGGAPAVGSVISRIFGSHDGLPPFVWDKVGGSQEGVQAGYVGPVHRPFVPRDARHFRRTMPARRLKERVSLLRTLDGLRREVDASGQMGAMDAYTKQAVEVLLSGKLGEALDLSRECPRVRGRYLAGAGRYRSQTERFLLARRLVEAGVRYVALNWGGYLGFDSHDKNYPKMRAILPCFDAGLSALIEDVYQRGLDRDVLIVVWGEFGRTPKVNQKGGRDHWPAVQSALVIGGGLKMGQVIGATDRVAGEATERPVHVHEVLSTIYHHLGIDVESMQLIDPSGRPRNLLDIRRPIRELL